jgi:hypothetical protein
MTPNSFSARRRAWCATSVVERTAGRDAGRSTGRVHVSPSRGLDDRLRGVAKERLVATVASYSRGKGAVDK